MEEAETATTLSRKELRKQKLMEYLAAKMKQKQPNSRPHSSNLESLAKKPVMPAPKVVTGKENKAPAARVGPVNKKVPAVATQSKPQPVRREPGDHPKGNVPAIRQNGNRPPVPVVKAPQKRNPASSTSTRTAAKQPNAGAQSSDRAPGSRFTSSANATWSRPSSSLNDRMSLAPMVKTKTGLVPALTQPRISQNLPHGSTTATDSTTLTGAHSAASKVPSSSSFPVIRRSATAQRKTLPAVGLNNRVHTRPTAPSSSTARAGSKAQEENKSNTKPTLNNQSKKPASSGLRSTSSLSSRTVASVKLMARPGTVPPRAVRSAGPATDRSTTLRPEGGKAKSSQTSNKTAAGASSATVSRRATEQGAKTRTDSNQGQSVVKGPQPQLGMKRTGPPAVSQTAPQPCRTISLTGQAGKTQKAPTRVPPQTEPKKLTAAQEERMRKLKEWREAKGISYKRPPMPVKSRVKRPAAEHQPFWVTMKQEEDASALISAVDRSLADCIKLLEEGCPADQVKEVLSRLPPVSHKFAKYWICRVRLREQEGDLDVLPMFEEAVGVVLEPVDELRTVVFDILKKKDDMAASEKEREAEGEQTPAGGTTPWTPDDPTMTPKPVRALICGEQGDSSVVKYKITATPGGHPSQPITPAQVNGQEVRFFTPVRRSVRIERASLRYPVSLQDHDLCVASYNELISEEEKDRGEEPNGAETSPPEPATPVYIYRQNEALKDKVLVQLGYDEDL